MKLLQRLRPILRLFPEVSKPLKMPSIKQRLMWTAMVLFAFLVCCQVPVYGSKPSKTSDPFYWMRVVLASNKGTLMELGISPIVTASLIMELLVGVKVINVDQENKEERALFEGSQKILALIITFVEASAYVFTGMYGEVQVIGYMLCFFIVFQLILSCVICILLGRGAAERVGARLRHLAVHCHKHLRHHCVEELLAVDVQHRARGRSLRAPLLPSSTSSSPAATRCAQ